MDATFDALRALDLAGWVRALLVATVLGLVVVDAVYGRRSHNKLLRSLAAAPEAAEATRARFLYGWARAGWLAAAVAVLAVWALPGLEPEDLGLRPPDLGGAGTLTGPLIWIPLAAIVGMVLGALAHRAGTKRDMAKGDSAKGDSAKGDGAGPDGDRPARGTRKPPAILPTGRRDRRAWAVVSVTAGITEEITYRGLALLAISVALPGDAWLAVVIMAVLFGVAHAYQGVSGMLVTGVLGVGFALLYLATGSLLPGMVLHALVDLRALMLVPPAAPTASGASAGVEAAHAPATPPTVPD